LKFPERPRNISPRAAQDELFDLLDRTVQAHMISDVPIGVLLSGGVDSSGVLSFVAQHADRPVHTFTIGFDGKEAADERPFARIAAERFGTQHHEIAIGGAEFRDFLPKFVWHMEELVCEPPAIALYFVTKLARETGVKVVLSGEGGDEGFAGYNTYRNLAALERIRGLWPPLPKAAVAMARVAASVTGRRQFGRAANYLSTPFEQYYFSRTAAPDSYFHANKRQFFTADFQATLSQPAEDVVASLFSNVRHASPLARMLYIDTKTWLPDDLLIKADKMTMANSVELRVPLLDHHVLEFAASLPDNHKLHGSQTKYVLKNTLAGRVPQELLDRKKMGFPVPIRQWINSELAGFVSDVLLDSRSLSRGYLRRAAVENLIVEHREEANRGAELFSLLSFELWHREFVDRAPVPAVVQR
jgi:asparagine synthase (glutamine-hydrolysing)